MLVKTGFYAMELLTAPPGYLAHMDADGSMLSLRYYEGLIALCKGIQNSLGFWITVFASGLTWVLDSTQLWDSGFVELYSEVQKQKFPGFLNPDSVTLGDDNYKEFEKMNNKLKVQAHILHV